MSKPLIIAIIGPTASGKSELAVAIAKQYNGEIISADSRQIYRDMNIGTGKVEGKWLPLAHKTNQENQHLIRTGKDTKKIFIYKSIPHYLIDEASPRTQYSVATFQKKASKAINDIHSRGKIPILCGGTGHWIDAVIYNQQLPEIKPNKLLRRELEQLSTPQLFAKLNNLDSVRATTIDQHNRRRLIRALEIVITSGKPVPIQNTHSLYDAIWIGLRPNLTILEDAIKSDYTPRLQGGMIDEVIKLHDQGVSWKKLLSFGLEYKYITLYLQNKIDYKELEEQLYTAIRQYAKRQLTWWKRNHDIQWFTEASSAASYITKKLVTKP